MKTSIWVVCFENPGKMGIHSHQLIYKAHELLNKDDVVVSAICMGRFNNSTLKELSRYGADEVIHFTQICDEYRQASLALEELFTEMDIKPELIIFPATEWGKCIASDLAVVVGAGLTAECIDIEAIKSYPGIKYEFTRTAINSTVLAKIQCINTKVCICTCKKNVFATTKMHLNKNIPIQEWNRKNKIIKFSIAHILHSEIINYEERNVALENAKVVFGIGRGVKDKDGLKLIKEIAKKYNAVIAGTRAVIEDGLIEKRYQVGQSGISISPEIYIAIGVSGAMQHIVGIKNAKIIISININPKAPIISYSDYYIIDDYKNIFSEVKQIEEKNS